MNSSIRVIDILNFFKYSSGKLKSRWSDTKFIELILESIKNKTILFSINEVGNLTGLIIWEEYKNEKRVHIVRFCAPNLLKFFFNKFLITCPGWKLTAHRNNKFVEYDIVRMKRLLCKIK